MVLNVFLAVVLASVTLLIAMPLFLAWRINRSWGRPVASVSIPVPTWFLWIGIAALFAYRVWG